MAIVLPPAREGPRDAADLFAAALTADALPRPVLRARDERGSRVALPLSRWLAAAAPEEEEALAFVGAPVLDVGCGPGRLAAALARRGVRALGVEPVPAVAGLARARGVAVLVRSIFDALPDEGAWATALLFDGNLGIGGDPVHLLRRLRDVLRPGGEIVVELAPPQVSSRRLLIRLELGDEISRPLPWARTSVADIDAVATRAGFACVQRWSRAGRWFSRLAVKAPAVPEP